MQQLTYIKPGTLRWDEVPEPDLQDATSALVRPFVVARCDLDAVFLRKAVFRKYQVGRWLRLVDPKVEQWTRPTLLKGPFPMGHECVAEVLETGADVNGYSRGDRVIVPFQVSCGTCPMCNGGLTSQCESHGRFDMYSGIGRHVDRGGMLSDVVRVPNARHMLVRLPENLDPVALASASDNIPDAWSRVAPELLGKQGKTVLVVGGATRSISLYCVAFAVAMGAARVDYLDRNPERRDISTTLGGNPVDGPIQALGESYDLVVNGSNRRTAVAEAVRCLKPGGVCTSMNIYLTRSTPVPFFQMYAKNLTLKSGLANPLADLPAMLAFIDQHRVDVGAVTTHVANWEDSADALLADTTKVVLQRAPAFG